MKISRKKNSIKLFMFLFGSAVLSSSVFSQERAANNNDYLTSGVESPDKKKMLLDNKRENCMVSARKTQSVANVVDSEDLVIKFRECMSSKQISRSGKGNGKSISYRKL